MSHPSLRRRLIWASTLLTALVVIGDKLSLYHEIQRSLRQDLDDQILHAAGLLTKSSELIPRGVIYEWEEAWKSGVGPQVSGMFQFWDLRTPGRKTSSPDLGTHNLPFLDGPLDQPSFQTVTMEDGATLRVVGLRHLPFTNDFGISAMKRAGQILQPQDYPQLVVYAEPTAGLEAKLVAARKQLLLSSIITLLAIWIAIELVTRWMFRPLAQLTTRLQVRSDEDSSAPLELPHNLPSEIIPLAHAFSDSLVRVETARKQEKDFAYGAAHQLRTPVAGLLGLLDQALSRPREPRDLLRRIGEARKISREIRATIESLMRVARLKSSSADAFRVYQPAKILDEVTATQRARAQRTIHLSLPPSPIKLTGDPEMFRVLVEVLIENAVRYSAGDSPIEIELKQSGRQVILKVENQASVPVPDDIERLFQPFQRGAGVSVNLPGAGLGLALAKEAARDLGGSVEMTAGDDQRVCLTVVLEAPKTAE